MARIERKTLGKQIMDEIVGMIKKEGLQRGDKLPPEKDLAEQLGVSRNSVREAMKSLSIVGITESTAGKGTYLMMDPNRINTSLEEIREVINGISLKEVLQVREILEVGASGLAALNAHRDLEGVANLNKTWEVLRTAQEAGRTDTAESGMAFHEAIMQLSGNRLLQRIRDSIMGEIRNARSMVVQPDVEAELLIHRNIYEAIVAEDFDRSRQAMQAHFNLAETYMWEAPFTQWK